MISAGFKIIFDKNKKNESGLELLYDFIESIYFQVKEKNKEVSIFYFSLEFSLNLIL